MRTKQEKYEEIRKKREIELARFHFQDHATTECPSPLGPWYLSVLVQGHDCQHVFKDEDSDPLIFGRIGIYKFFSLNPSCRGFVPIFEVLFQFFEVLFLF